MSLPNVWHHRRVADASARACDICYKPSTSVMITSDKKDFFYVCLGHLKDRNFCSPIVNDEEVAVKKKKEALEREIELVKKEYEEKQKAKAEKRKAKEKDKGTDEEKDKAKESKQKNDDTDKKDEEEKNNKIKALSKEETKSEDGPRIYALHKTFYQKRVERIRSAEMAKRNRERLSNPTAFPSVPSGDP